MKPQYRLISPLVLKLPYAEGRSTLDTDDCKLQAGFVLFQIKHDEPIKPVPLTYQRWTLTRFEATKTSLDCLRGVAIASFSREYALRNSS